MRVLIEFGYPGIKRDVSWWRTFGDIPKRMRFQGEVWDGFMYQEGKAGSGIDWEYYFTKSKDPNVKDWTIYSLIPQFEDVFNVPLLKCECGSLYTGFPQFHMFYCPKWEKQ
jgi:hypothetical protein